METPVRTTALALAVLLTLSACTKSPNTASSGPADQGDVSKMLHQDISQAGDGIAAQPDSSAPNVTTDHQIPAANASQPAPKPGFDCAKATTRVEHLICSDKDVADMDAQLTALYTELKKDPDLTIKSEQAAWLRNTRNRCETIQCLSDAYKDRLDDLETLAQYLSKTGELRTE